MSPVQQCEKFKLKSAKSVQVNHITRTKREFFYSVVIRHKPIVKVTRAPIAMLSLFVAHLVSHATVYAGGAQTRNAM